MQGLCLPSANAVARYLSRPLHQFRGLLGITCFLGQPVLQRAQQSCERSSPWLYAEPLFGLPARHSGHIRVPPRASNHAIAPSASLDMKAHTSRFGLPNRAGYELYPWPLTLGASCAGYERLRRANCTLLVLLETGLSLHEATVAILLRYRADGVFMSDFNAQEHISTFMYSCQHS
ncbi:hypothetical protein M011DRAFT_470924 [Sporormia fimetaria CBS 119925]|uniref:Uncharacterized protein n=1 Tax=Sporormia fimetaria CBS 119925 TaxID=1340428 RepID=A0A6A6V1X5_9PLEO|nr:hypothetical protein M011DRAFT_470924 [Sporormia fimetaria CBS 119925]